VLPWVTYFVGVGFWLFIFVIQFIGSLRDVTHRAKLGVYESKTRLRSLDSAAFVEG
jgi:hypothetical protein